MNPNEFLDRKKRFAVVGVSSDRNKWGWKIFNELKSAGFHVFPVNPRHMNIDNDVCYPDLKSLPEKPEMVIIVVKPEVTERIIKQCKEVGINRVWMQPGSESKKAIGFCKSNGIQAIYNACFVMNKLRN